MTAQNLILTSAGALALTASAGDVFDVAYDLLDYLGQDVVLEARLSLALGESVPTPATTVLALTWRDSVTDDVIYEIDGVIGLDAENPRSITNRAEATQAFRSFEVTSTSVGFAGAITACDGYNPPNTRGRNVAIIALPDDQPPAFDEVDVYNAITLMQPVPAYIVLPDTSDLPLWSAAVRASDTLNIPLDAEIDPMLTVDQAVTLADGLDAADHRITLYWNPNLSRPRDAVSLRGAKKPRPIVGWLLGQKLLRNARTGSDGIPPIADTIAGEPYPVPFKAIEQRNDIVLDEPAVERLAKAKINVVRQINYDTGTFFVISDVLTQYVSENSALRLTNSAEIICFTTNVCIGIIKRHMLKRMSTYLSDASRDIEDFLSACSLPQVGLLQPAEDLGGQTFAFSLVPDEQFPFERVRFEKQCRPDGAVRSANVSQDVVVK